MLVLCSFLARHCRRRGFGAVKTPHGMRCAIAEADERYGTGKRTVQSHTEAKARQADHRSTLGGSWVDISRVKR